MPLDALMLEVVTPERELIREPAGEVQLPGREGYLGILPGHTPLLTELGTGVLSYRNAAGAVYVSIAGGFAEVLPGRVIVLAEAAERAEDIDVPRAQAAFAAAEKMLASGAADASTDWNAVQQSMARARARLEVAAHGGGARFETRPTH